MSRPAAASSPRSCGSPGRAPVEPARLADEGVPLEALAAGAPR